MNILFLTLTELNSLEERGIYQDLIRTFKVHGHSVTIVTPVERKRKKPTKLIESEGLKILQVRTFNIQKTNVVEKGVGTLAIEYQYLSAIKNNLKGVKYDLILYSTPPITFGKVIQFIKKRDGAYSYLLLKDIFPQNAVDIGMIKRGSLLHRFFLKKEQNLYKLSDTIGCMSQANVNYVINNNANIQKEKIEVNPNSIEPREIHYSEEEKMNIRMKYGLPLDKKILVYGGNLGKPQGLNFLLETIEFCTCDQAFFLVVGDGTEFSRIENWFEVYRPGNAKLFRYLTKIDYDLLLAACDIGLIFLDRNFLIPNFPSRLLSYLEMKKPVIAATDPNTDIGDVIETANCGVKVLSGDVVKMNDVITQMINDGNLERMGENALLLLKKEYLVNRSYNLIVDKVKRYV